MGHPLTPEQLGEIARLAEAGYPDEVCGAVIGRRGEPATYEIRPLPNIAGREGSNALDGRARDARTAYLVDPLAEIRLLRELDDDGREIVALYHSHPETEAVFSALDREMALTPGGEPWWPGVSYLIVSVRGGTARTAVYFTWDPAAGEFAASPVVWPIRVDSPAA